ncbi:MAG: GNAT family N-acetyltransferase [Candidatus Shapirobacteria bacterium]|jgi:hypothetical protein
MITYQVVQGIDVCHKLWQKYSSNLHLSQLWNYRLCFHRGYQSQPHFIVAYEDSIPLGFIPLEFYPENDVYQLFGGGDWNEKLDLYMGQKISDKDLSQMVKLIPQNHKVIFLSPDSKFIKPFEPTYYISLKDFPTPESLLANMDKKHRKNLRLEFNKIDQNKVDLKFGDTDIIDSIVKFNQERFGQESSFGSPGFDTTFKLLLSEASLIDIIKTISIYINGHLEAAAVCANYHQTFTYLQGGSNPHINNLGKYLNYQVIKMGYDQKPTIIDLLSDDCGWKTHWRSAVGMTYQLDLSKL